MLEQYLTSLEQLVEMRLTPKAGEADAVELSVGDPPVTLELSP